MRLNLDEKADALYLRLDESPIVETAEVSPGMMLDYNAQKQVVGVEILNVSKRTPALNPRAFQFQTA